MQLARARYGAAAFVAAATVIGSIGLGGGAAAQEPRLSPAQRQTLMRSGVVGASVVDALATREHVRVIVLFEDAPAVAAERRSAPSARAAIRGRADRILGTLDTAEFAMRHRFEGLPGFAGTVSAAGLLKLAQDPNVLRIDPDRGGRGRALEANALVRLDKIFARGYTGAGVQVALLDSGVDLDHDDFASGVIAGECFCSDPSDGAGGLGCCPDGTERQSGVEAAQDDHGHGTNVGGVITSDGLDSPQGGAPDAEIVAVKVLDENNEFCCASDVIAALDWIHTNRPDVDVVNLSLGTTALYPGPGPCDLADGVTFLFSLAIDDLRSAGVLSVAASLNEGSGTEMSAPACIDSALSVGAVWDADVGSQSFFDCTDMETEADLVACYSNSNEQTDLFAPGGLMSSAAFGGGSSQFVGTSQATAVVSACAAALRERDPSMTPDELQTALLDTPARVTDETNGLEFPRLDCGTAFGLLPAFVPALHVPGAAVLVGGLLLAGRAGLARLRGRRPEA